MDDNNQSQTTEHTTPRYWTIVFPGEFGQHVQETWSEKQILDSYYTHWCGMMIQNVAAPDLNPDSCIDDWKVVHWAMATNEFGERLDQRND